MLLINDYQPAAHNCFYRRLSRSTLHIVLTRIRPQHQDRLLEVPISRNVAWPFLSIVREEGAIFTIMWNRDIKEPERNKRIFYIGSSLNRKANRFRYFSSTCRKHPSLGLFKLSPTSVQILVFSNLQKFHLTAK